MKFKKGNIPLYFQFYLHLKQEIISGDRMPGSPIATLNDLAEQTGISHGMIRKALELLEKEELITKNPKRGTFVREGNQKAVWLPGASMQQIREDLVGKKVVPLTSGFITPPNRVMTYFKGQKTILKNEKIFQAHFVLLSTEDQRRKDLIYQYIPYWRYQETDTQQLLHSPILTVAADMEIKRIRQVTRPWFCDHYSAQHLNIPDGTPILHRTIVADLQNNDTLSVFELLTNINALEIEKMISDE